MIRQVQLVLGHEAYKAWRYESDKKISGLEQEKAVSDIMQNNYEIYRDWANRGMLRYVLKDGAEVLQTGQGIPIKDRGKALQFIQSFIVLRERK